LDIITHSHYIYLQDYLFLVYSIYPQTKGAKMSNSITLNDIQGKYEISYQSYPPIEDWYEPGFGSADIVGDTLIGKDALGVTWNAKLFFDDNGRLNFTATLDPTTSPDPQVGLLDRTGNITRTPQNYSSDIKVTKFSGEIILRTRVIQGPITIDVQFRKMT
jgi:hypothetical protein